VGQQSDDKKQYQAIPLCGIFLAETIWRRRFKIRTLVKTTCDMKKIVILVCSIVFATISYSQDPASAAKGVTYGEGTTATGAVNVSDLEKNMKKDKFEGKVTGKVMEVCQEKGCWMKVEKGNGETLMVKFKDYGFFMPKDIVGKEVVLDGEATVKEVSVKQLQHYAKDAGKTDDEVKKITKPKKEVQFVAKGVLVM
jgi:Domain of unknown function (DUF4920)